MGHNYLFFCSHSYAIPILRPLQKEILKRGDQVAWFLEDTCPSDVLAADDRLLTTREEVRQWNPKAVFAPGNWIYPFFPGVKVELFHGYPINKRNDTYDDHFRLRGWFDMYCTSGPSNTPIFRHLEQRHGYFKVYETGWVKADAITQAKNVKKQWEEPTIFVATTFSKGITKLRELFPTIKELAEKHSWRWMITMHPKLNDPELTAQIEQLAENHDHVTFYPLTPPPEVMAQSDVMLCDASSIIMEYMLLDKPVVTYCNTTPGPHLLNVTGLGQVEQALQTALQRPRQLMAAMRKYVAFHETHTDGQNCARILDAVDDFVENYQGNLPSKPFNLWRRIKLRWQLYKKS